MCSAGIVKARRGVATGLSAGFVALAVLGGSAPAAAGATTSTGSCVDGGGITWHSNAVWGPKYLTASNVARVQIDTAGWTTNAGVVPTDSTVRTYSNGVLSQSLTKTAAPDYRSGTYYDSRNPLNPVYAPGKTKVTVSVGKDGDGKSGCTVTHVQPTTTTSSAVPAQGTVIWRGDFEQDISTQFKWRENVGTPQATRVTTPIRQGSYSGRFEAPASSARNEVIGVTDLSQGQIRYFGFSMYLDPNTTFESSSWGRIFAQWRYNGYDASPPLSLQLSGTNWRIQGGPYGTDTADAGQSMVSKTIGSASADRGRWIRWVVGISFKGGDKQGWVSIWKDGNQILAQTPWKTLYTQKNGTPFSSSLKLGVYRDSSIPYRDVVHHDNWLMATTYDAAK